jgi:hypothetical protein
MPRIHKRSNTRQPLWMRNRGPPGGRQRAANTGSQIGEQRLTSLAENRWQT